MEIEKTLTVAAPPQRVWAMLLDPQVMGGCVPGMQSIEVVSDVEYVALMHVKIAFVSAKFKLRTTIVEQREPSYLRAEGTGEDASVASSLKQQSEIFLTPTSEGGTELRIKVKVDVLGRLGTFGLSVMKTKADRMWEEFGTNLAGRIDGGAEPKPVKAPAAAPAPTAAKPAAASGKAVAQAAPARPVEAATAYAPVLSDSGKRMPEASTSGAPAPSVQVSEPATEPGWWSRLLGARPARSANVLASGQFIRIEVRQLDKTVSIDWPLEGADQCKDWLRDLMK
ncbi:SRPBCC family protein [Variovorax sp. J2P1-59]|uniref:CoxG family protein n=1 Tax=Variovorax flavidus TaxID=3053501 RepID=UPI0025779C99|nr:SRPBCC family protein [Variovorax sp. J2P1-59]MDM0072821.1 SRPBCC family protein [Variovorax sp. J2P1-59]